MLMDNTLRKHIVDTDKQAKERFETLMAQMLEKNPIDIRKLQILKILKQFLKILN